MFNNFDAIETHLMKEFRRLKEENALLYRWINEGEDTPCCCVCGKPIKGLSLQRRLRPYRWDSRACFDWKPRKIVALERDYGLDILRVLKETARRFGSLRSQTETLGVSVPYFITIVRKYGKCDYLEFMAEFTTGSRKQDYLRKLNGHKNKKLRGYRKPTLEPSPA